MPRWHGMGHGGVRRAGSPGCAMAHPGAVERSREGYVRDRYSRTLRILLRVMMNWNRNCFVARCGRGSRASPVRRASRSRDDYPIDYRGRATLGRVSAVHASGERARDAPARSRHGYRVPQRFPTRTNTWTRGTGGGHHASHGLRGARWRRRPCRPAPPLTPRTA